MARRVRTPGGGPQLRADVLSELRETWGSLRTAVPWIDDLLTAVERGDEVVLHRRDLPEWCPDRDAGRPGDLVRLRTDNTIIAVEG